MTDVFVQQVYDELKKIEKNMATKQELLSLMESIEVLSNPDTMRQIASSADDIKHKNTKDIHSVQDLFS
jgi:hypothetical protein